jgi:hypothetical protein
MITVFSTPKPFVSHIDIIQRNAIRSWQRLDPSVEIILVGDDAGTAEVCQELGINHIKEIKRNRYGTKYLSSVYDQVQEVASYPILCHVNCDIVLMSDFLHAAMCVSKATNHFLMAGRRWDVDIRHFLDFSDTNWEYNLRRIALEANRSRPAQWIDYFVFPKGFYYKKIPEFVIGRPGWDNWLLWYALTFQAVVVDASKAVLAVHQNHDYGYHPDGEQGVWHGEEALENYRLLDGDRKFRTLESATFILEKDGLRRNYWHWLVQVRRSTRRWLSSIWFGLLNVSRPIRHRFGLQQRLRH